MIKAHVIKLIPTKGQRIFFNKSCGVARFSYNWALNKWKEDYSNGTTNTAYTLIKHLNSIKRDEFPWMQETGKTCSQYAIHNLWSAYKAMWKIKSGYPKFKKKGAKDSFVAIENKEKFKQDNFKIWIPRLGWVKCLENCRFNGAVNNVVVKRIADMWFAVININVPTPIPTESENQTTVGIDMGIKTMLILSDGTTYQNPRALKRNLKSLKRLHRGLTRKKRGSKNRKKQAIKIARRHYRISCIRKSAIHKATTEIVGKYDRIVIESLRPNNMIKNRSLSQAIHDVSFGEIVRQLKYKTEWSNKELIKADQWFPSSKLCSVCGNKNNSLTLYDRTYNCLKCGISIDRDLNAAINLANYSPTLKNKGSEACGEVSEPSNGSRKSMKQEITIT